MEHKAGFYEKYIKRLLDIIISAGFILVFFWLYIILWLMVRIKLGSPVLFRQERPGKDEKIFDMIKFRTMTDARDERGELLPDDVRLTKFGRWLRSTSLDELPEFFLILNGKLSICGPRPLLPRDVAYMDERQHRRHLVRPGLTGLAQCSGRNGLNWDEKLDLDVQYVDNLSFGLDLKILLKTVVKVFKSENVEFEAGADMDLKEWNELKKSRQG